MKRAALSISISIAALGIGACEMHSSAELPEHYQNKWGSKHAETEHQPSGAPHGEAEKAPAGEHKG